jgi:oligosaccharide reducing-end xylanase
VNAAATLGFGLLALALQAGCGSTVDALGRDPEPESPGPSSDSLRPLVGPSEYPNPFRDDLGKSAAAIRAKQEAAFQQLFHGDASTEAIYFEIDGDQASIRDLLHDDIRSEGIGLGMMIAVQLDHREEFDKLWRYAAAVLRYDTGPSAGYFRSSCDDGPCTDPYGHQEIAMALLFAHGRWGSRSGDIDYGLEALKALDVMWSKEATNGGVVDGVTNLFDLQSLLPVDEPSTTHAGATRPANVKPGYYALWAQATADSRWEQATLSGRAFFKAAAHPKTGLLPLQAAFDGTPAADSSYVPEGYRAQVNMVQDHLFARAEPWYQVESDRLLTFFAAEGIDTYGKSYSLDGSECLDCTRVIPALVATNGISALPATIASRKAFLTAVWDAQLRTGNARYYDGVLQLLALLTLGGQMRVY